MTAILERRESESIWGRFCNWITSTENRLKLISIILLVALIGAISIARQ